MHTHTHGEAHGDSNEHDHGAHGHGEENYPDPEAGAMLDIGGEVGALVIYCGEQRVGEEVHVAPLELPGQRTHTVVRLHPVPGGHAVPAALFPALTEGSYRIVDPAEQGEVTITGGAVTEATSAN